MFEKKNDESKTLTIKHVPDSIKRQFLALCALSGKSVQEYTNNLLADHVTRNQHKLGIKTKK